MFLTRNNVEGALAGKNITVNDLTVTGKLDAKVPVEKIDVKEATLEKVQVDKLEVAKKEIFGRTTYSLSSDRDTLNIGTKTDLPLYDNPVNVNVFGTVNINGNTETTGNLTVKGNETISGDLTVHNKEIIQLIRDEAGGGGGGGGDIKNINCETLKVGEDKTDPDNPTYIMTVENNKITIGDDEAVTKGGRTVDTHMNGKLYVYGDAALLRAYKIGTDMILGEDQKKKTIEIGTENEKGEFLNDIVISGGDIRNNCEKHIVNCENQIIVGVKEANEEEVEITEEEETKNITLKTTAPATDLARLDTKKIRINCPPQNIMLVEPNDESTEVMDFIGDDVPFEALDPNKNGYYRKEKSMTLPEYIKEVVNDSQNLWYNKKVGDVRIGYTWSDTIVSPTTGKKRWKYNAKGKVYIDGAQIFMYGKKVSLGTTPSLYVKLKTDDSSNANTIPHICNYEPPPDANDNYEEWSEDEGEYVDIALADFLDPRTCVKLGTNLSEGQDIVIGTEKMTQITNEEGNEETIYDAMGNVDIHGKTVNIDGNIVHIGDEANGKTYIKGSLVNLGDHSKIFVLKDGTTMSLAEYASQAAGIASETATATNFGTGSDADIIYVGNTASGLKLTGKKIVVQNADEEAMDLNSYIKSTVGTTPGTALADSFGTTCDSTVSVGNVAQYLNLSGSRIRVKQGSESAASVDLDTHIANISTTAASGSSNLGTNSGSDVVVGNTNNQLTLQGSSVVIYQQGVTPMTITEYLDNHLRTVTSIGAHTTDQVSIGSPNCDVYLDGANVYVYDNGNKRLLGTFITNRCMVSGSFGTNHDYPVKVGNTGQELNLNGSTIKVKQGGDTEAISLDTHIGNIATDAFANTNNFGTDISDGSTVQVGNTNSTLMLTGKDFIIKNHDSEAGETPLDDYILGIAQINKNEITKHANSFGTEYTIETANTVGNKNTVLNLIGSDVVIVKGTNDEISLEDYVKQKASIMTSVTVADTDNANETTITPGWVVTDNATVTEELAVGNITVTGQVSTENITTETSDGVINVNRPMLIQNEGEGDSYSTTINGGSINAYEMRLTHELNGTDATFTGAITANSVICNELNTDEDELPVKKKMRFSDPLQNAVMDRSSQYTTHKVMINLNKDDTSDKGDKTFNIVFTRLNELYIAVTAPTKLELAGKEWLERFNAGTATLAKLEAVVMGNIFPDGFNTSNMVRFEIPFNIRATFTNGSYSYAASMFVNPPNNNIWIKWDNTQNILEYWSEENQLLSLDCTPGTATVLCPIAEAQYDFI